MDIGHCQRSHFNTGETGYIADLVKRLFLLGVLDEVAIGKDTTGNEHVAAFRYFPAPGAHFGEVHCRFHAGWLPSGKWSDIEYNFCGPARGSFHHLQHMVCGRFDVGHQVMASVVDRFAVSHA